MCIILTKCYSPILQSEGPTTGTKKLPFTSPQLAIYNSYVIYHKSIIRKTCLLFQIWRGYCHSLYLPGRHSIRSDAVNRVHERQFSDNILSQKQAKDAKIVQYAAEME